MMYNIEELEREVKNKTELLKLLKVKKAIKEMDLNNITFSTNTHTRTKIQYVYACLKNCGGLRQRVKTIILPDEEFDINSPITQKELKIKLNKFWEVYTKKYYPEYYDILVD